MILKDILLVFALSLISVLFLTPWVIKITSRLGIFDRPDPRKVHTKPVATLGGIAIYLAFVIAVLFARWLNPGFKLELAPYASGLFWGGSLIVVLGICHDLKNIRPATKLIGQILVSLVVFSLGLRIEVITNPFGGQIFLNFIASLIITVFWIVALVNAVNLIDGLDGLAAGLIVISSVVLLCIAMFEYNPITVLLIAALIGATAGFLRFNFHPAKIFMGDAGSMFLGFIIAAISILGSRKLATTMALLIPLIALTLPVFDTFLSVMRRSTRKLSIFRADRKHLHHRLLDMGLSHKQAVLFLYLVCFYFGLIAFLFALIHKELAFILLILLAVGVLMGMKTIVFIERKVRILQKMQKRLDKEFAAEMQE